jgi:hypothetical protein
MLAYLEWDIEQCVLWLHVIDQVVGLVGIIAPQGIEAHGVYSFAVILLSAGQALPQ